MAFSPVTLVGQKFEDVAQSNNITFGYNDRQDGYGCGISFYDFNNDGWADLSLPQHNDSLQFYRNDSGSFKKFSIQLNNPAYPRSVLWWDFDNDGDSDLFVTQKDQPHQLYEDTGNMEFNDITRKSGIKRYNNRSFGASVADINKDGLLDLYVCNYNNKQSNVSNQLYLNQGNGNFKEIAGNAQVQETDKASFQGIWIDVNDDGWPDLYVINDYQYENSLFLNNGNNTFREVSQNANVDYPDQHSMSASASDFDHDGDLDIYITNSFLNGRNVTRDGMFLERNNNLNLYYDQKAVDYNINIKEWSWGAIWLDRNNNTWKDLVVATSRFGDWEYEPIHYYENQQADTFIRKTSVFKDADTSKSEGIAKADFNHDGFNDMFIQQQAPRTSFLWKNTATSSNNYLKVSLIGTKSNRMAIGSKIHVYVDTHTFYKYTQCGQNYMSQNSQYYLFGLDDHQTVDSLKVEYLSGHVDKYYDLSVNKHYRLREGETINPQLDYAKKVGCKSDTLTLGVKDHYQKYKWNTGSSDSQIIIDSSGKYWVEVTNNEGVTDNTDTIKMGIVPTTKVKIEQPSCFGNSDGTITLKLDSLSRQNLPTISWKSSRKKGKTLNNISKGLYEYIFRDTMGCTYTESVKVREPNRLSVTPVVSQSRKGVDSLGVIQFIVNGGTKPYQYYLDSSKVTNPVSNLPRGTYQLKVKDAKGCIKKEKAKVLYSLLPEVTVKVDSTSCGSAADGSITLMIDTLPNAPFKINWNNGAKGVKRLGLAKGWYTYRYTDLLGGSFRDSVYVPGPPSLRLNTTKKDVTKRRKGQITLGAKGGISPYTYYKDGKVVTGDTLKNLSAGKYQLKIKDRNGCSRIKTVNIRNLTAPDIAVNTKPVSCHGQSNGIVSIKVKKRNPGAYGIQWKGGEKGTSRNGLSAGKYTFTYQDTLGFTITDSVQVQEPAPLTAGYAYKNTAQDPGCKPTLKVSGGNQPYQVSLNGNPVNYPSKPLSKGSYTIKVSGDKGCDLDTNLTIPTDNLNNYKFKESRPTCRGYQDGTVQVQYSGNAPSTIKVNWLNGKNGRKLKGLPSGSYPFMIKSNSGCKLRDTAIISKTDALTLQLDIQRQPGENKIWELNATSSGGTPPYRFYLNGSQTSRSVDSIAPGMHVFQVTDQHDCTKADTFSLQPETGLKAYKPARSSFIVQPNPVERGETVRISAKNGDMKDLQKLVLLDATGSPKVLKTNAEITPGSVRISTVGLPKGFYILKCRTEDRQLINQPLIIQ